MAPNKILTSGGHMAKPVMPVREKPQFSISEKELPAIKDWSVGKKYTMTLNVEMVSSSKGSDYDVPLSHDGKRKEIHNARFKVISVDAMPSGNAEVKEESN